MTNTLEVHDLAAAVRAIFGSRAQQSAAPTAEVIQSVKPAPAVQPDEYAESPSSAVLYVATPPAPTAVPVPTIPLAAPATEDAPRRQRENLAALQEIAFLED